MWEGVGDWTELQHIDLHSYGHNSISFPCCSTGGLGTQSPWDMFLIPASSLQLTWTSCHRGYIIIWHPLFFLRASQFRTQFNPSTVKVISWYSSTGCTCYLHRCISYFDGLARSDVNIQQNIATFDPKLSRQKFKFILYLKMLTRAASEFSKTYITKWWCWHI